MEKSKTSLTISSVVIVIIFIAVIVYAKGNYKNPASKDTATTVQNQIMDQDTQSESSSGLKITTIKEGTGAVAKAGDMVSVNYTGTFENGTAFDSNVDPKFNHVSPFEFNLGAGQVIKGWDEGVVGMKVGEKRKLFIPSSLAYGERGAGSAIPPNANLIFEVELLAIK
jgi:FKBP-type peptidyl-prolyl cis-trans isomerase